MNPIFSPAFLSHYISDFNLSSVTDIRGKKLIINALIEELKTGKLESLKEEELKSRFLNQFFGDILGFNYGNSEHWMLREEKKSTVDGTKPDAVLGYCSIKKEDDDIRVVIEIKNANTNLEEKQTRAGKTTPIEQAFGYVSKMGGSCKWVVVSNIKEIRFYPSLDQSKYQSFLLADLVDDTKLKELLFLFHKDRFIKNSSLSPTDILFSKSESIHSNDDIGSHIIDKIYSCLRRFQDLGFVDPNYISTLKPFNVLNEHVWHYSNGTLFTNNGEIYSLLQGLNIESGELEITSELLAEITASNVIDYKHKLEWSLLFLNHSFVNEVSAIKDYKLASLRRVKSIGFSVRHPYNFTDKEGITKKIRLLGNGICDCISCNYRTLDFDKVLNKLKVGLENDKYNLAEYAYGNYLVATNNFKTTYSIYKRIERDLKGKQGKGIEYFLTKKNIKLLHNLVLDYQYEDGPEILSDIKSIDLDKVIYDEIEFDVDNEVKEYLIKIKEDEFIYKIQDEIEDLVYEIVKLKSLYQRGGKRNFGPDLVNSLLQKYFFLYLHINRNYIVYDIFKRYKSLCEKVFKGLVDLYFIPDVGQFSFNEFILSEAFLHIDNEELQRILIDVDEVKTTDGCIENLLERLNNFTRSYYKEGLLGNNYRNELLVEQLNNFKFQSKYAALFSNIFTILSRLKITKQQFNVSKDSLINFLKVEQELSWPHLKQLCFFIQKKGDLFEAEDLFEILKIAIGQDRYDLNKYQDLIINVSRSLNKFHSSYIISNDKLIQTAILNCKSEDGGDANYIHIVDLVNISNEDCRQLLYSAFEKNLDKQFDCELYETLLQRTPYSYLSKNYFQQYAEYVNKFNGGRAHTFGKNQLTTYLFINFALVIYNHKIDFDRPELKILKNSNSFESWLLNPVDFDYSKFDAKWLIDIHDTIIIDRLKNNTHIGEAIDIELKTVYNPILAELKYRYFQKK